MIPRSDATFIERLPAAIFWTIALACTIAVIGAPVFFFAWYVLGP